MSENSLPMTEQDEQDLAFLHADDDIPSPAPAEKHTLLEIWTKILSEIEHGLETRVSPVIANKIVSSWPKLSYQDVADYHVRYHHKLKELRRYLTELVERHPEALKNIDDDSEANHSLYVELISEWQNHIKAWENNWDAAAVDSHIELAAIADASAFYLGEMGLMGHLSSIGFQLTALDEHFLVTGEVDGE